MNSMFTNSNADLLNRPIVSNAAMREAGWDAPGNGYATVYSMEYGVTDNNGKVRELLLTPIYVQNGLSVVKTSAELKTYVNSLNGKSVSALKSYDNTHNKLLLDIDTDETRAEILHLLQEVYYTPDGEPITPVTLPKDNPKYLEITNAALRHRGLIDQFYKEYSYWVRNARIANIKVRMELAQLLSIDKTVRQKIGDITGFVKKMQYSVDIQSGMSEVTVEMWYL
jgi:hypothetical protein